MSPLQVYFTEDCRRNIIAVAVAMLSSAGAQGMTNVEYIRGVLDTSRAHAILYGIPWAEVLAELREALPVRPWTRGDAGRDVLLDAIYRLEGTITDGRGN